MSDIGDLLSEARDKADAAAEVALLRQSLVQLDDEIAYLDVELEQVLRPAGIAGLFRRLRRGNAARQAKAQVLGRRIETANTHRLDQQRRLQAAKERASGVDLARAKVSAELARLTASLRAEDPQYRELAELDNHRADIASERRSAQTIGALADELRPLVAQAEAADDGSDVIYVELSSASRKREKLAQLVHQNAAMQRLALKDRLEAFQAIDGFDADHRAMRDLIKLANENVMVDHVVWLHEVRMALNQAREFATSAEASTRKDLSRIDARRIEILTRRDW